MCCLVTGGNGSSVSSCSCVLMVGGGVDRARRGVRRGVWTSSCVSRHLVRREILGGCGAGQCEQGPHTSERAASSCLNARMLEHLNKAQHTEWPTTLDSRHREEVVHLDMSRRTARSSDPATRSRPTRKTSTMQDIDRASQMQRFSNMKRSATLKSKYSN